jgi:hypothetical protein
MIEISFAAFLVSKWGFLPAVTLALVLFCCIPFARNIGKMWSSAVSAYLTRGVPEDELVSDELSFIREHTQVSPLCGNRR